MPYKALLESKVTPFLETERFKHFKNPILSEKYYENYISYKEQPVLDMLTSDLAYLAQEQTAYPSDYAMIFLAENVSLDQEIREYLEHEGFALEKYVIFIAAIDDLNLSDKDIAPVTISPLTAKTFSTYLDYDYQHNLLYGQAYADQMRAFNVQKGLALSESIYLAMEDDQIIGVLRAWDFGDYVEMDDFQVEEAFRGRGIGSALQKEASKGHRYAILIAEEINRDMYQHQAYQEVAYYWTALRTGK